MAQTESHIYSETIDPARVEMAYYLLMSFMEEENYSRAELMTALIVCLGTQWNGGVIPPDETAAFVRSLSEYLAAYFAKVEA